MCVDMHPAYPEVLVPAPAADPSLDEGATRDAMLLVERVCRELTGLAHSMEEMQGVLGPTISMVAAQDPAFIHQAQALDLAAQSLRALSTFLAAIGKQRIGHEPLDFDKVAATLTLRDLGERLAGRASEVSMMDIDLF